MAKQQSFAEKSKAKHKNEGITIKLIKSVTSDKGTIKFNERFVGISEISKVTEIK